MKVYLPESLEEVWKVWDETPEARVYAGGTDLMVKLRGGFPRPPALICLERIPALKDIREEKDAILIGAGASHAALMRHPLILTYAPVLAEGLRVLGSPLIRNMGTLGGNIVTASPAGDSLPALYVRDAQVVLANAHETRMLPISAFILGPGKTALKAREIISGIHIKKTPAFTVSHYEKVGKRKAMAIAVASLAACIRLAEDGTVEEARLAWGSVGPTIVRPTRLEVALRGQRLPSGASKKTERLIREAIHPISDIRAGAAYREEVAANLFLRLSRFAEGCDARTGVL